MNRRSQRLKIFNDRPMVSIAAGFILGILLTEAYEGTWLIVAVCLFLLFGVVTLFTGQSAICVLSFSALAGILRTLFLPNLSLPASFLQPFAQARESLLNVTSDLFGKDASILQALLWGYKGAIPSEIYSGFQDAGIAHVLALSGLHVSFVVSVIALLTNRRAVKFRFVLTALFLFGYCAVTAFPASLVRASIMTLCVIFADIASRKKDMLSSVSFAAVLILLFRPSEFYAIGFQLSFMAVATIAMLYEPLKRLLPFLRGGIADAILVTLCGTLGTLPLLAYYFNRISLVSLLANILLLPAVSLLFLSGLAVCGLMFLWPLAALWLSAAPRALLQGITYFTQQMASLPYAAVPVYGFTVATCLLIYLGFLMLSDFTIVKTPYKVISALLLFAAATCIVV